MSDFFYGSNEITDEIRARLDALAADMGHFSGAVMQLINMPTEVEDQLAPTVYRLSIEANKIRNLFAEYQTGDSECQSS